MKKYSAFFLYFAVAILLVGCATSGAKFTEMAPSILNSPPDMGRIYFYRTSLLGAAIQPDVTINGAIIGEAVPNGFFYVDRAPGNYEIMTSTEVDRKLSFTLEKGQTRYVRLNISMGFFVGHVYPELVEPAEGGEEIQDCRFTGPKQ